MQGNESLAAQWNLARISVFCEQQQRRALGPVDVFPSDGEDLALAHSCFQGQSNDSEELTIGVKQGSLQNFLYFQWGKAA
nr:hypothetical protein [uncultured Pseudogulbenkiania sp.]